MDEKIRYKILLSLNKAFLGEIYPNIRAIVFDYDQTNQVFTLRYYLDRDPTQEDFDSIDAVVKKFLSYFPEGFFITVRKDCVYSNKIMAFFSKEEIMECFVYARQEYFES